MFDHFYRREGTAEIGNGRSLAIVRNISETHQTTVLLSDNLNGTGLVVTVKFP